jgi:glycosyltransferase involved in cell wall biosynthesis
MKKTTSKNARAPRPRFSIITICYNARETLEQTLRSVTSQKGPSFEYLVVDGGSTDGTLEILKAWNRKITWWASEKDRGISDAFNKGVRRARGEWIGTMNADDWYEDGALAAVAALPEGIDVACGKLRYWEGSRSAGVFGAAPALLPREMTINHPATFTRRSAHARFGLYREDFKYAMDYEFFLRCQRGGARFAPVDAVLANMRYGGVGHRQWLGAAAEVRRAQRLNGAPAVLAWRRWIWRNFRSTSRLCLEKLHLGRFVAWYRRRLSIVRKRGE